MRRTPNLTPRAVDSLPITHQLYDDDDEAEQQQGSAPAHRDVVVKACPIEHEVRAVVCCGALDSIRFDSMQ